MDDVAPQAVIDGLIAPVMSGAMAQLLLYGVLLMVFTRFISTSAWTRAHGFVKAAMVWVMLVSAAATALAVHDVLHYATLQSSDIYQLISGTLSQCFEPLLAGLIALTVQSLLIHRATSIIRTPWIHWAAFCLLECGAVLSLFGAIEMTISSIGYYRGWASVSFPLSPARAVEVWMWSAAAVDVIVSGLYIAIIRKHSRGSHEIAQNVVQRIGVLIFQSATYTALLAVVAAVSTQVVNPNDPAQYCIPYAFWMPLSAVYPISLFTTLSVGDRVHQEMSDFNQSEVGSFYTSRRGSVLPATILKSTTNDDAGICGHHHVPTWHDNSANFLGVKVGIENELSDETNALPVIPRRGSAMSRPRFVE